MESLSETETAMELEVGDIEYKHVHGTKKRPCCNRIPESYMFMNIMPFSQSENQRQNLKCVGANKNSTNLNMLSLYIGPYKLQCSTSLLISVNDVHLTKANNYVHVRIGEDWV